MIKALIVDDSPTAQELLRHILSSDPEIRVIGTAGNGKEALEFVERNKPDVITMDLTMPEMDGYSATRTIMETTPIPVVVVSASLAPEEVEKTWPALEAGAVAAIGKPDYSAVDGGSESAKRLIQTVKLMSQVRLVRRWKKLRPAEQILTEETGPQEAAVAHSEQPEAKLGKRKTDLVAIGASTGGPPVLRTILSGLEEGFPAPIMVVQHIARGFSEGLVSWLDRFSSVNVRLAEEGERIIPGRVYVAPEDLHMGVGKDLNISLSREDPEYGLRPSVSYMFRSVAKAFGKRAIGILLTGMGKDGAYELKLMKDSGAVTIAQDEESSIVHGMPAAAIKLGGTTHVLSPEEIQRALNQIVDKRRQ